MSDDDTRIVSLEIITRIHNIEYLRKTGKIDETVTFAELREMIPAGALVRNTIKFNFWTKSGNFGVKMYTQNCLFKLPERTELTFENTFGDDSDEESKGVGPVGELIEKPTEKASDESKTDNEGETEDVDDSDSGDESGGSENRRTSIWRQKKAHVRPAS